MDSAALSIGDNNWNLGGVNGGASFPDAVFTDGGRDPIFFRSPVVGPVVDEFLPKHKNIQLL